MKKIFKVVSLAMAIALILAMAIVPASAAGIAGGEPTFDSVIEIEDGEKVPNVTFAYTISGGDCVSEAAGVDTSAYKTVTEAPTAESAVFADTNTKDADNKVTKTVKVDLSKTTYNEPGVYRYTITQTNPNVQGVTVDTNASIILDVYVYVDEANDDALATNYVFHTAESTETFGNLSEANKVTGFENKFSSYDLTFKKTVSGNQASHDKYFKFTVKVTKDAALADPFTSYAVNITGATAQPEKTASTVYEAADMKTANDIASVTLSDLAGKDFYLKDGESIVIVGLPKGVTYEVTEVAEDYTSTTTDATSGTIDGATSITYNNARGGTIPTGVMLSVIPGVAVLGAGAVGLIIMSHKRKSETDDEE